MSARAEAEIKEVALWYHEHKKEAVNGDKNIDFLYKAIDHLIWLNATLVKDIQALEGRAISSKLPGAVQFIPEQVRRQMGIGMRDVP
jgi:hypothetical protein